MNKLKPLDIAHKFIRCLHNANTGNRKDLAKYLGITPAWVNTYRNKIEKLYKVTILYSRKHETYFVDKNDLDKLPPRIILNNSKLHG